MSNSATGQTTGGGREANVMNSSRSNVRTVYPPTWSESRVKARLTEAQTRMTMNDLHPEVAENPNEPVVQGGVGCATGNRTPCGISANDNRGERS